MALPGNVLCSPDYTELGENEDFSDKNDKKNDDDNECDGSK